MISTLVNGESMQKATTTVVIPQIYCQQHISGKPPDAAGNQAAEDLASLTWAQSIRLGLHRPLILPSLHAPSICQLRPGQHLHTVIENYQNNKEAKSTRQVVCHAKQLSYWRGLRIMTCSLVWVASACTKQQPTSEQSLTPCWLQVKASGIQWLLDPQPGKSTISY